MKANRVGMFHGKVFSEICCRLWREQLYRLSTGTCVLILSCLLQRGAFHRNQPSDLMPELQGRFPIRVELDDLTKEDFVKILQEPRNSLTKQYAALMETEGITLEFKDEAIEQLASFAYQVNQTTQNIGARRLYTILEKVLEELSFDAAEMKMGHVDITAEYVNQRLEKAVSDEDLSKFIL